MALIEALGAETVINLKVGDQTMTSMVPGLASYNVGDELRFDLARDRLHLFGADGTRMS